MQKASAWMGSTVSVRSIPGTTSKATRYYLKGCLEDPFPDAIIVHHGTNDLKIDKASEDPANDIVNSAVSVKNEKTIV